ncbi:hypothetical protein B296_00021999 [Ensete ventricosum]|uniref:Uncharacterized protein n=1 Tax=Ensete ventricosum TaxID=4639 RepID=A0A427AF07_ENSVE|nr:hypothetical protein B296_00021999 [Ensete ventricosum]
MGALATSSSLSSVKNVVRFYVSVGESTPLGPTHVRKVIHVSREEVRELGRVSDVHLKTLLPRYESRAALVWGPAQRPCRGGMSDVTPLMIKSMPRSRSEPEYRVLPSFRGHVNQLGSEPIITHIILPLPPLRLPPRFGESAEEGPSDLESLCGVIRTFAWSSIARLLVGLKLARLSCNHRASWGKPSVETKSSLEGMVRNGGPWTMLRAHLEMIDTESPRARLRAHLGILGTESPRARLKARLEMVETESPWARLKVHLEMVGIESPRARLNARLEMVGTKSPRARLKACLGMLGTESPQARLKARLEMLVTESPWARLKAHLEMVETESSLGDGLMSSVSSHSESRSVAILSHRSRVLDRPSEGSRSTTALSSSGGAAPTDSIVTEALAALRSCFNVDSIITTHQLVEVRKHYYIPSEYKLHVPLLRERPYDTFLSGFSLSIDALEACLRFPLHLVIEACLEGWHISPSQMVPNSWRYLVAFLWECYGSGIAGVKDMNETWLAEAGLSPTPRGMLFLFVYHAKCASLIVPCRVEMFNIGKMKSSGGAGSGSTVPSATGASTSVVATSTTAEKCPSVNKRLSLRKRSKREAFEQLTDASRSTSRVPAEKGKELVELEEALERGYTIRELCDVEDRA